MPTITSTHIQLTLTCEDCGHEWDVDDYDSQSVAEAERNASEEACPECAEEQD